MRNAGLKFRLPTVREWTYVCRAGGRGHWGKLSEKTAGTLDTMGWYARNCGREKSPVARKKPNAWGFFDMHGNV
ncbi:MAG: SUMF1/EgtB/PvdO family nonheme iron enzyme [Kiritimatiellae bacterium]|nr:SUMF1/EgtB/PvdO family nonheme iron enzyme [Kiritimatiellia bacterium]